MPYKRGEKWVAQVKINGKKVAQKIFLKKKDAKAWEVQTAKEFAEDPIGMQASTVYLIEWANAYLDHCIEVFPDKTFREKKGVFKRFFKFVDMNTPVTELTQEMVMSYMLKRKKDSSGNAANKDRKNLVAAWNWGKKYMKPILPTFNPCQVDKMPEVRQPRYIPPEEDFWKVYNVVKDQDRIMLLTFLYTAGRRNEIFNLKWSDIDLKNSQIRLWTKKRSGGDYEYNWLPLTTELKAALLWWRSNAPLKDSDYVFVNTLQNHSSLKYGEKYLYRNMFMKRVCEKAKVKYFGFHAIRHLTASILYNKGYGLFTLQSVLRHKSPSTTNNYLHSLGFKNVKAAMEDIAFGDGSSETFQNLINESGLQPGLQEKNMVVSG